MKKNTAFRIVLMSVALLLVFVCLSFARTDHREYKDMKPGECQGCHSGAGIIANHGAFWLKEHRLFAQKANNNCFDCHQQSFCLDCHKGGGIQPDLRKSLSTRGEYMPQAHRSDFISIHPIKAADDPQSCYRCHQSSFCQDCHSKVNPGSMKIKSHLMTGNSQLYNFTSAADHAAEARRNLQSCEACHPDADVCVQCHKSGRVNPHPRNWSSISNNYKNASNGKTCAKCHTTF